MPKRKIKKEDHHSVVVEDCLKMSRVKRWFVWTCTVTGKEVGRLPLIDPMAKNYEKLADDRTAAFERMKRGHKHPTSRGR